MWLLSQPSSVVRMSQTLERFLKKITTSEDNPEHISVHTNSDPIPKTLSSFEVDRATATAVSLPDSEYDTNDLHLPKQPRTEQGSASEVSAVNTNVAKRRSTLTETEKYNFYFSTDIDFKGKFTQLSASLSPKVQMVDLQSTTEWWVLPLVCTICPKYRCSQR